MISGQEYKIVERWSESHTRTNANFRIKPPVPLSEYGRVVLAIGENMEGLDVSKRLQPRSEKTILSMIENYNVGVKPDDDSSIVRFDFPHVRRIEIVGLNEEFMGILGNFIDEALNSPRLEDLEDGH